MQTLQHLTIEGVEQLWPGLIGQTDRFNRELHNNSTISLTIEVPQCLCLLLMAPYICEVNTMIHYLIMTNQASINSIPAVHLRMYVSHLLVQVSPTYFHFMTFTTHIHQAVIAVSTTTTEPTTLTTAAGPRDVVIATQAALSTVP